MEKYGNYLAKNTNSTYTSNHDHHIGYVDDNFILLNLIRKELFQPRLHEIMYLGKVKSITCMKLNKKFSILIIKNY